MFDIPITQLLVVSEWLKVGTCNCKYCDPRRIIRSIVQYVSVMQMGGHSSTAHNVFPAYVLSEVTLRDSELLRRHQRRL